MFKTLNNTFFVQNFPYLSIALTPEYVQITQNLYFQISYARFLCFHVSIKSRKSYITALNNQIKSEVFRNCCRFSEISVQYK